ncbi:PAS domain S-box protein [Methylobacter sp.]|uniref:PAS domain S-box protein n=2 Tax=Methylobacter sp. TaxID=2051955 RepID=UPI002FE06578
MFFEVVALAITPNKYNKIMHSKIFNDINAIQAMADFMPIAIFIKDAESKFLLVNKACEAQWGLSYSDLYGTDGSQFFPSDQMAFFLAKDQEVFSGKCQVDFEETVWNATLKQNRIGHTFKNPIYDFSGKPLYLICVTIDITERKQADNYEKFHSHVLELLTANEPLSRILESIVLGVERYYPEMLCSILLLDKTGRHFDKGIAPSLPDSYNTALDGMEIGMGTGSCGTCAFTGERVIVDDIATHPYWSPYKELAANAGLAACWSQPIRSSSGNILGAFAIYHHQVQSPTELNLAVMEQVAYLASIIIERKQIEEELRIAAIAFETQEGMMITDSQGVILRVNHAFTKITGYTAEDAIGQTTCRFRPDEEFNASIWRSIKRTGAWQGESMSRRKNGEVYPEYLTITAVKDYMGEITRYVATMNDISEHKYRLQQDKKHLDELAHVTRLGLMGEMASGIAHEVNQPLAAISSYTQLSLKLINSKSPDLVKLNEIATKTQKQALRAGQIIHSMKRLCKSNSYQLSNADINILINDCVMLCADGIKQNSIALKLELEENLPSIPIDHIQIEQVIINLIRNSIDALQNTPVIQHRQITIKSQLTPNNNIQIRVKDNGIGIDEDQRQKVLMPFHTTKADGMGMGLSISRSIIEARMGTLRFNSRPGKGCSFYITLPIQFKPDNG